MPNFIYNGRANGSVATTLLQHNMDPHALRPYIGNDGRSYINQLNSSGKMVARPAYNTAATLRQDDWKILDDSIIQVAKERLKFVGDIRARGLTFNIPNGMGKTVLETEVMSDIEDASISMDGLRQGPNDRPQFDLTNLPLPIIHKDFSYSARQIAASRNGGSPLDVTSARLAARKVSESIEKLALGRSDSYQYGGGTIYGLTNFPNRVTYTITAPTASGWVGSTLLGNVMAMRQEAYDINFYGPFKIYVAPAWDQYLDDDYKDESDITVRERINKLDNIEGVETLDYLTGFDIIMVQLTSDVIREVIGMDITTVQWESNGGMQVNFKVMGILIPQIRADYNDSCGIVHGSTT